jgi:GDPmannose 4,6-dehydratase
MKRAFITGITGQDGAYLAKFLLEKGYEVFGAYRRISSPNFWRLQYLDIFKRVKLIPTDMTDQSSIQNAISISLPDEIYHLAAQSFVEASFQTPHSTGEITGLSVVSILESVRHIKPDARFYFAGTSELYGFSGIPEGKALNEKDSFKPMSPYAAAKLYGYWITRIYREGYGIFASNGILFNHESPLRGLEFVTRKIATSVAKIKLGLSDKIVLGNLEAQRDWGYAPEYVDAMWNIMQLDNPDDYVVATGETHSVREFLEYACSHVGINYEDYLFVDRELLRPLDLPSLKGDYSKIHEACGWNPGVKFKRLVELMVDEELQRWRMLLMGKTFPWDAPNYPSEQGFIVRNGGNGR